MVCAYACPPGEQDDNGSCVACPSGQKSQYGGVCSAAACAGGRVAVGQKCVFQYTTKDSLKTRMQECICGDTSCNTLTSTAWRTGVGDAVSGCGAEIEWYDVSALTQINKMIWYAGEFNQPLNEWDVSNVQYFGDMFATGGQGGQFNQPLDKWDTSNALDLTYMFNDHHTFNQDISAWNVSKVTNMQFMFYEASAFNQDLSGWDTGAVLSMYKMFENADAFNSTLDWALAPNCEAMFGHTNVLVGVGFGGMDTSRVTNMDGMFQNAAVFNGDIGTWDVSNVANFRHTFKKAVLFNADISAWNVSSATDMYHMFYDAEVFNQDISGWDVRKVTNMNYMFAHADAFGYNIGAWDVSSVTSIGNMFTGTTYADDRTVYHIVKSGKCVTHGYDYIPGPRSACTSAGRAAGLTGSDANEQNCYNNNCPSYCYATNGDANGGDMTFNTRNNSPGQCSETRWCICTSEEPSPIQLCGSSWVSMSLSDKPANVASVACDCPTNKCVNGGVCSGGTCTCAATYTGPRCQTRDCGANKVLSGDACVCESGLVAFGSGCKSPSQNNTAYLNSLGLVGSARSAALREAKRPVKNASLSARENMFTMAIEDSDVSSEQLSLMTRMRANLGTVLLEMQIAAEQTTPLESPSATDCNFDLSTQEASKKTVVHAYDVGHYVYLCNGAAFVAEVKETSSGADVRCRDGAAWSASQSVPTGGNVTCGDAPLLIGSVTAECGPGLGCCGDADCVHGTCSDTVCVCDPKFTGEWCDLPSECVDITDPQAFQSKGCCRC